MRIHLIAVHLDTQSLDVIAFTVMDVDTKQTMIQNYSKVFEVVSTNKAIIHGIEYDTAHGKLKGSNGTFDRYPAYIDGQLYRPGIVILNTIDDIGYTICNGTDTVIDIKTQDLIRLLNKQQNLQIANGKIVTKDETQFISSINGSYENVPAEKTKLAADKKLIQENRQIADEIKKEHKGYNSKSYFTNVNTRYPRVITGAPASPSHLKDLDPETKMTVEQKLMYVMLGLKVVRPFYYTILSVLHREEANVQDGIDTMGVTLDTLYFSAEFVKAKTLPELMFTIVHEICHIAMKHGARGIGRHHEVFNYACDYYINKVIAVEFGINAPGEIVTMKSNTNDGVESKYKITLPTWVLYEDSIDINVDTPEKIYEELMKNAQSNGGGSSNSSQSGEGSSMGSGSGGGGGQGSNESQSDSSDGQGENQDNNQDGQNQSGNSQGGNGNGNQEDGDGQEQNGQNNQNRQNQQNQNGNEQDGNDDVSLTFRGKEVKRGKGDIVRDSKTKSESAEAINQKADSILRRAVTIHKQSHKFGDTGDFLERQVAMLTAKEVNWLTLLRNKLTLASQKINTFAAPDKRFRSRGMILPGPKNIENDALENVKICIDTSGSITDRDIGEALGQIKQLLKQFKAEAELLYWDTDIKAIYPFKDIKEILSKKPVGGGGTDANCIFRYFETNKDYKIGKKKKPSIIIIFTDGCFGEIDKKYSKYRDTIWIINNDMDRNSFKVPFGQLARFKSRT